MTNAFDLKDVLPWGRNRAEYTAFFNLSAVTPETKILDCAGGPASFNAEMTAAGYRVTSADPLYAFSAEDIEGRVAETRKQMITGLRAARHRFDFTWHGTIERHEEIRMNAVRDFLDDFEIGRQERRYRAEALPALSFGDERFDIALCSHFLFLYSGHLDTDAHIACVAEMMRVGTEARIFPLLDLDGNSSHHINPVREALEQRGFSSTIQKTDYEFQKGGHSMLRIVRMA